MRGRTHFAFALFLGLVLEGHWWFVIVTALSSFLPDIDEYKSTIGKKIIVLSFLLKLVFGHRGFFHSLLFVLVCSWIVWMFFPGWVVYAFVVGVVSHLFLDALTPAGVRLFWPLSYRVRGVLHTKIWDTPVFLLCLAGIVWALWKAFFP